MIQKHFVTDPVADPDTKKDNNGKDNNKNQNNGKTTTAATTKTGDTAPIAARGCNARCSWRNHCIR